MLWTDLITPAEATGYIRAALEDLEINQRSLNRYLPSEYVTDISVRFVKGQNGFVAEARFRAYDAEPEFAGSTQGRRVTIELPAIGQQRAVSEYDQLRNMGASDEVILNSIQKELRNVARAIFDRIERLRGYVLATGRATVDQDNFGFDDDFGRSASHTTAATTLWTTPEVSRLTDLTAWLDVYSDSNDGAEPGIMVMSKKGFRALASGTEFSLVLADGTVRPGDLDAVRTRLDREGLPEIELYDRSTSGGRVLPANSLLFLPSPVDPIEGESELGKTYWGRTVTSLESSYDLQPGEQPGVVASVHKADRVPHTVGIESDAIALPVLGDANKSFIAQIIP